MASGWSSACSAAGAHRKPQPRGAISHLWQLPTYQSAPVAVTSSGTWPGACAPSISTRAPAACASRASSATGRTSALAEAMWSSTTARARAAPRRDGGDDRRAVIERQRDLRLDDRGAAALGDVAHRLGDGAIGEIGDEDLVAGAEV